MTLQLEETPRFSLDQSLSQVDPEMNALVHQEFLRQRDGLELIASENFTSRAVMECLGSVLTNKYSEGRPGKRYYGGNEIIDQIEELCQSRALQAYHLEEEEWEVNVQPYSGSVANLAVYAGLLAPHDRLMGLDLPSGGHLTHGYHTPKKKVSISSLFFESMPYVIGADGYIDYDDLERRALLFHPKLIICGGSAYPRDWDYERFRHIADQVKAYLMCDMAHISGLVAAGVCQNPFTWCDLVTTTTHKTMRGPRAGMIFLRKDRITPSLIHDSVFPSLQGGPHDNQIGGIAVQLKEIQTESFHRYAREVVENSRILAQALQDFGYDIVTQGTDTHLVLWNVRPLGLTGSKVEKVCEKVGISLNKNAVYGDTSPLSPGGIRIGTAAMTTRGLVGKDWIKVATLLHHCLSLAKIVQNKCGKKLVDFMEGLQSDFIPELKEIQENVCQLAQSLTFYRDDQFYA